MTDARLKSFADRIDRLEEERKAIGGDVRDVYVEVKSAGYNPKALRKVLADRRRKTDDQLEAEIERYRAALGVPGATYRGVAEQIGVSKSKLQRLVPRKNHGTPHDPETGEIKASEVAVPPGDGEAPDLRGSAGTPSPIVDAGGAKAPAVGSEPASCSPSATPRPVGEAEIADRSNDDAIAAMLAAKDRLDALKRQKGLAA